MTETHLWVGWHFVAISIVHNTIFLHFLVILIPYKCHRHLFGVCSPGAAVLRPVCYEEEMDINCSFSCLDGLLLLSHGVSKVTRSQRTMQITHEFSFLYALRVS